MNQSAKSSSSSSSSKSAYLLLGLLVKRSKPTATLMSFPTCSPRAWSLEASARRVAGGIGSRRSYISSFQTSATPFIITRPKSIFDSQFFSQNLSMSPITWSSPQFSLTSPIKELISRTIYARWMKKRSFVVVSVSSTVFFKYLRLRFPKQVCCGMYFASPTSSPSMLRM